MREGEQDRNSERQWFHNRRQVYGNVFDQRQGFHYKERDRSGHQLSLEATTSFFFTNFIENFGTKEMRSVFNRYGKVSDIYFPSRKNK